MDFGSGQVGRGGADIVQEDDAITLHNDSFTLAFVVIGCNRATKRLGMVVARVAGRGVSVVVPMYPAVAPLLVEVGEARADLGPRDIPGSTTLGRGGGSRWSATIVANKVEKAIQLDLG
jgi:precorrin isomerase